MKKVLILATIVVLILVGLVGCQEKQSKNKQIKTSNKREIPDNETPEIIGEKNDYEVSIYFANQEKEDEAFRENDDESDAAYQFSFPLKRTIKTTQSALIIDTVKELLKGPTKKEKEDGYYTEIHNIKLDSISIDKDIATAKFSGQKFYLAGDMSGPRVRAQIEKTILQFEGITKVIIHINGKKDFDDLKG